VVAPDAATVGNRPASRNRPPYRPSVRLDGPIAPMLLSPDRALPVGAGWILEPNWDDTGAIAGAASFRAGERGFATQARAEAQLKCSRPRWTSTSGSRRPGT